MDRRILLCIAAFSLLISCLSAQNIGVNYGSLGDNLPSPDQVVDLYKSRGITKIRLFDPNPGMLQALHDSGIQVLLGTFNQDLENLASDPSFATQWVANNILPHINNVGFRCISAGNEVIPYDLASHVLPAMKNLDTALAAANINIPVSTAIGMDTLGTSYPPSAGAFNDKATPIMQDINSFLAEKHYPILMNVYSYYGYTSDPTNNPLDYALFLSSSPVMKDGDREYWNLFDAMMDAAYAAMEKTGGGNVDVIVAETGWPSANGLEASVDNAKTYNNKVVDHVKHNGTPAKPGKLLETYLFAMFNENKKPDGIERAFGLYNPDKTEVYHVDL